MGEALVLWSHALASLGLALLAGYALRRPNAALPRWPVALALALTALWALAVAGVGTDDAATRLAQAVRTLGLLGLMVALHRDRSAVAPVGLGFVYGVVMALVVVGLALHLAAATPGASDISETAQLFAMLVAVTALVLVQNLRMGAGTSVRLLIGALALLWCGDLAVATAGYLDREDAGIAVLRGVALLGAVGSIAGALGRRDGAVRVSRTVAYQSLSLVAIGAYLAVLALATSAIGAVGGDYARALQTAFVLGSTAALLTLVSSGWLRAWIKVKIAKHLFAHRYDYRAEWMRFSGTLGAPDEAPLLDRATRAIAQLTESPAGLLLVAEGDGLGFGAGWNWTGDIVPAQPGSSAFADFLSRNGRIVALDPVRRGEGEPAELAAVPQWLLDRAEAWAVVPLLHLDTLTGAVVLARPPIDRALDWEDFDLLRVAGRQVASHLAEARARDALTEAARFDEFNRRFAFIVHDIKNLVSGLTLVARNAERHADNPAFRADMVATLQDSATKLSSLLARLSHQPRVQAGPPGPVAVTALAERVAAARRSQHPVIVRGVPDALAHADAAALEQVIGHLLQNAIEASPATEPVTIAIDVRDAGVEIAVIDRGCGMTPAFVRDQLFRPFASSKPGGFGIGAYEARQLAAGFGGRIEVDSREGEGTTFRILLAAAASSAAPRYPLEQAA